MKQSKDDCLMLKEKDTGRIQTAISTQTIPKRKEMEPSLDTESRQENPKTYQSSVKIAMRPPPTAAQNLKKPSLLPKPKVKNPTVLMAGKVLGKPRGEQRMSSGGTLAPATDNIDGPGTSSTYAQQSPNSRIPVRTMTTVSIIEVADASDGAIRSTIGTNRALIK